MTHRKTLGFRTDAAETAARTMVDPRATQRIFAACDWEIMNGLRSRKITAALDLLGDSDRAFAELVLSGKTWRDIDMPKRTFNWRLKRICDSIAHPPPFAHC